MLEQSLQSPAARQSDPEESHLAAHSISLEKITFVKKRILYILDLVGNEQLSDEQILYYYERYFEMEKTSISGLRSRRNELAKAGYIVRTGTGKTSSGRKCALWSMSDIGIRSFHNK